MAKYLGPYDVFKLTEDGKEYHIEDNVPVTKEQRAQWGRKYMWEDDEPIPATPTFDIGTEQKPAPNAKGST